MKITIELSVLFRYIQKMEYIVRIITHNIIAETHITTLPTETFGREFLIKRKSAFQHIFILGFSLTTVKF